MPADVYSLTVAGRDDDFAHLFVVVAATAGGQRLCIPGYGSDGEKVNRLVNGMHRQGIYEGVGWVELDNRVEVVFRRNYTGKEAKWVPYKLERIEQRRLRNPVGQMRDMGLARIVDSLVQLHMVYPGSTINDEELPLVRQLAITLGLTLPARF